MNPEIAIRRDPQEVAFVLATHISRAKTNSKAVKLFANFSGSEYESRKQTKKIAKIYLDNSQTDNVKTALIPADQKRLTGIRQQLLAISEKKISEKKGNFSTKERISLLLQAKFRSGLSKEERVKMYKEAGYTDHEISLIDGTKITKTLVGNIVIGTSAWAGLGAFTIYDNALPFLHQIPNTTEIALASIGLYTLSYIANTMQNLRLTKTFGSSIGFLTTGLFTLGNRLLPERARDWTAGTVSVLEDGVVRSGLYTGAVAVATGDPHKVIVGCLFGAVLNVGIVTGSEIVLWRKKKKIA